MAGIVFDASALIALVNDKDPFHEWALDLYFANLSDNLYISALTFAEVLVHPSRNGKSKEFISNLAKAEIEVVGLSSSDSIKLADIRASSSLKMPDAVVVQLGEKLGAKILTTDKALAKVAKAMKLEVVLGSKR